MNFYPEQEILEEDLISELAKNKFGIKALTPLQRYVIANTLDGLSQLVVMPTGAGKSICFQLPSLLLEGPTGVVVPLLSLLQDQIRSLRDKGIQATVIKGEQDEDEREKAYRLIQEKQASLFFVTPEILENSEVKKRLSQIRIAHLVIDEAHCASEWGKSFRPAYRRLPHFFAELGRPLISAFTATASPEILNDLTELFYVNTDFRVLNEAPDRFNLSFEVWPVLSKNKALTDLALNLEKPLVVFTRSRQSAELTSRLLRRRLKNEDIFFYHAGLSRIERKRIEEWFFASKTGILCATSAYGMGVDKPDIRSIVHREIPPSVESYLQEAGRAGRDGLPAKAILFNGYDDEFFFSVIKGEIARKRYQSIYLYANKTDRCRRNYLLSFFGHSDKFCFEEPKCDYCSGNLIKEKIGEKEIKQAVLKNKRRFTTRQLVHLLKGEPSYLVKKDELFLRSGYGSFKGWEFEDLEEALQLLVKKKLLLLPLKGIFKNRYNIK